MAKLFTDNLSPAEVQRRVGDMRQLAGAEPFEFSAGNQRGVRAVRLYNAAGLDLDVIAERGMGLGRLAFQGAPLAWMSPTGMVHPTYLEGEPLGWLRNFPGGFLTPCGLTQVGSPGEDNGEKLGIHGRLSNLAAENLSWGAGWQDGRYIAWAQGAVREARVFGENLLLTRRVSLALDEPRLWIEDRVENQGFSPAPHMFLQHINLGFPLLGPETRLQLPAGRSVPRDDDARPGLADCCRFQPPTPGYREQVFYHYLESGPDGRVEVRLENPAFGGGRGLGLALRYARSEYPVLVQWKMMGEGMYVLGLEPANCHVEGRAAERARGTLQTLEPDEVRSYRLEFEFFAAAG